MTKKMFYTTNSKKWKIADIVCLSNSMLLNMKLSAWKLLRYILILTLCGYSI